MMPAQDTSASTSITPTPEVSTEFKLLKMRRKYRYIFFRVDENTVVVDLKSSREATFDQFIADLPESECIYAVYDHEFKTSDGRLTNKLYFITWIPPNSHPSKKMAYTHAKTSIRAICNGCFDVNALNIKEIKEGMGMNEDGNGNESDSNSEFED